MKVIISFLLIIIIDLNSFCEANNIIGNSSHRTQVDIINDTSKMPLSPSSADCRNLKVIPFNQCDPSGSWINDYLNPDGYCNGTLNGNKYSVCAFGCALTCLAMLINAYEHSNDLNPDCDPHTLNVFCNIIDNQGNNQGYDGCANIIWSTALQYPGSSTNPQDYGSYSSFDLDAIKVQINNQNPVIMKVTVGGGPIL